MQNKRLSKLLCTLQKPTVLKKQKTTTGRDKTVSVPSGH